MSYPTYLPSVYEAIHEARRKAHEKHGARSIESINAFSERWLAILTEEVGEVAHELTYDASGASHEEAYDSLEDRLARLRTELIQVAAVAAAWVEAIEGKESFR